MLDNFVQDGKIELQIPIVFGMVIAEDPNWLEKLIAETTAIVRENLERAGFLYQDSYYKSDVEWGTLIIWAELPKQPEKYITPKLGNFWDEEKQRQYLNTRKMNKEKLSEEH